MQPSRRFTASTLHRSAFHALQLSAGMLHVHIQKDFRDFNATVVIILVPDDEEEAKRKVDEIFGHGHW